MKRKIIIILLIIWVSLTSFGKWIETTGKITGVEKVDEGYYGYILTYEIDKSSAFYNIEEEFIEGPLASMIFTEELPINNQEIRMKYDSEDPMFFKFIDDIKLQD